MMIEWEEIIYQARIPELLVAPVGENRTMACSRVKLLVCLFFAVITMALVLPVEAVYAADPVVNFPTHTQNTISTIISNFLSTWPPSMLFFFAVFAAVVVVTSIFKIRRLFKRKGQTRTQVVAQRPLNSVFSLLIALVFWIVLGITLNSMGMLFPVKPNLNIPLYTQAELAQENNIMNLSSRDNSLFVQEMQSFERSVEFRRKMDQQLADINASEYNREKYTPWVYFSLLTLTGAAFFVSLYKLIFKRKQTKTGGDSDSSDSLKT
jgi:cell division protein FtsL